MRKQHKHSSVINIVHCRMNYKYIEEINHLERLIVKKSFKASKTYLEQLDTTIKGYVFVEYLALLYRGNGWLAAIQEGKGDAGGDLLLFHPEAPDTVAFVVQAKNWMHPLTYDDTKIELLKFEEQGKSKYTCSLYKLVAVNGFVKGARALSRFNLQLSSWHSIEQDLLRSYNKDGHTEPRLELYPHNERSYKNVVKLFKKNRKVCLIQATGTGKSYVIAQLIADTMKTQSIIVAPSHYILNQLRGKFRSVLSKCTLMTYAKVSRYSSQAFHDKQYDLIVLDEFHRPGSKVWGKGVERLLKINKNSKVFGTSATPIRYLDQSRDMSSELFDGNIAEYISLITAIVRGIVKAPVYVSALYTLDEEYTTLKQKISESNLDSADKEEKLEAIKNATINWENTKGIPHILTKYLKSSVHKLIVFCRDTNHLNAMELEVQKWFLKSFRNRKRRTYRVLSSDNENDKNLREFVTAKDDTFIHLLFCIDMLNEGLHVPDVAGVILVRPTESPRVFYQQIGRCIQAGSGNTPIIFDFVNNFRNISANNFIEDINTEVDKENEIRKKHDLPARVCDVHIYDETKEIIELFETIEVTLQSWRVNYNHLQEYRKIHPDRWPQASEEYPVDNNLGLWCSTQRKAYTKQKLSQERIRLLEALGFMWSRTLLSEV